MTKIYTNASKQFRSIALLGLLAIATNASAQDIAIVTPSSNCGIIREDFDQGNGSYTSSSIYSNTTTDADFYYNKKRGFWTELGNNGQERSDIPSIPRIVSIVSPAYNSPNTPGNFDVGFRYIVPNALIDKFQIVLVRITTGETPVTDVVAKSGFKTFADFSRSTPTAYIDATNSMQNGQQGIICIRLQDINITTGPNIKYRVSVAYQINSGTTYTAFDDFSLNNGNVEQAPLPVHFIGINAKKIDNAVEVSWDVADEINVDHYEIERSSDGRNFKTIGSVYAGKKNVYSYTDGQLSNGAALYRVKNVDIDGRSKYSSIVRINFSKIIALRVYPSPATNFINLEHPAMVAKGRVTVSTIDGRTVKVLDALQGTTQTGIELTGLHAGMYIIRFNNGNGKTETIKIVKQ